MAEAQAGSNLYEWCSSARPQSFLSRLLTIAFPSSENSMRGRKPLSHMAATSFWTWLLSYTTSMESGHCSRCQWTSLCLVVIPPFSSSAACPGAGCDLAELCRSSSTVVCNFCQWDICKFKRFLPEVSKGLRPLFSMDMKGFRALVQPGLPWRTKAFANRF